jgi:hypothetical protein
LEFVYYPFAMRTASIPVITLVITVFCSGCLPDTGGIEPPNDRLIFPVGLAATGDAGHLLVVNSNFDLEYNAGTFVAMDLGFLDEHWGAAADGGVEAYDACGKDGFSEVSQDDQYCFVKEEHLIDEAQTIRLGAFASDLEMTPSGSRALIPVRGERAIIVVDVDEEGDDLLSCGEGADLHCASSHMIKSNDNVTMPIEPYEVATMDYANPNGGGGDDTMVTLGFATHLAGGEVSLFSVETAPVDEAGQVGPSSLAPSLLSVIDGVVDGASGIAVNTVTRDIYVTGRHDEFPHVAVLQVRTDSQNGSYEDNPWFSQVDYIDIEAEMYAGTNARSLAVTRDGGRAFLATREPDALVEFDIDNYAMSDMVTVCNDPSAVALYEDPNDTIDPFDDSVYAFVLCFLTGQLYVIDTALMQAEVRTMGSGPQAIAVDRVRELIYVANFRESTISVIEAVPPFDHLRDAAGRIVKLGVPRMPKGHD